MSIFANLFAPRVVANHLKIMSLLMIAPRGQGDASSALMGRSAVAESPRLLHSMILVQIAYLLLFPRVMRRRENPG